MDIQLKALLSKRSENKNLGIPSYCTANDLVIKALLLRASKTGQPVLIEATANQVNQFGGYTGMTPKDFVAFVHKLADEVGCDHNIIYLGGDHLGPLTWKNLEEKEAMEHSKKLVHDYVSAGFTKIHIDTSMKLKSDPEGMLATEIIAERGAILHKECIKAFEANTAADKIRPVYIIGSEVPIPGGATENEDHISVTSVADFKNTVDTYKKVYEKHGLTEAFEDIIGVVVQPGVEFSDTQVFLYDKEAAKELSASISAYPGLVFEGHSTDYQTKECLREMVADNIAILKVGPALTYRFREALFMLDMMEKELVSAACRANFAEVLEEAMLAEPKNWENHYHGTFAEKQLARKYSYSDRARYYFADKTVKTAIDKLLANFEGVEIPMNILHQFMPAQYQKIMRNELANEVYSILFDAILEMADDYEFACK